MRGFSNSKKKSNNMQGGRILKPHWFVMQLFYEINKMCIAGKVVTLTDGVFQEDAVTQPIRN